MISLAKRATRALLERCRDFQPAQRDAVLVRRLERSHDARSVNPGRKHLQEAVAWLKAAQDESGTDGVSWGYRARRAVGSNLKLGWLPAYPETTGYIIPTLLRYAGLTSDGDCVARARRMTDWETGIQLPDGGFQGGVIGSKPVASSTFVTGQVLFGLVAGAQAFGDDGYRTGARKAGDFLLDCLDESGKFSKGYSHFCAPGSKAYEARTGLALGELGRLTGDRRYLDAAGRMADYTLSCQLPNGWFRDNDLDDNSRPLTHTIGYALEGLHGLGMILSRDDCLDAVERTLKSIAPLVCRDGFLPGRWYEDWTPAADWACLTGCAQIAGVFLRMSRQRSPSCFREAGARLLGFVAYTQELRGESAGMIGGIRGSYPFQGGYLQWCVPNWASKFFADSVMDYLETVTGGSA